MKIKYFMLSLLGIILCAQAKAETGNCGENCTYILENNVLTIKPTDETKPAVVQEYNRDCTGRCHTDAPWFGKDVTQIDIKEGVTDVRAHAFEDMGSVTSVKLPEGLKTIGHQAFNGDNNLSQINLPDSLEKIEGFALNACALSDLKIPSSLTKIEAFAFSGNQIVNLVIPETVTEINPQAFYCITCDSTLTGHINPLETVYCSTAQMEQCQQAISYFDDVEIREYQKTPDGKIFYGHQWYENANDILSGKHIKKRIYTVDEATKALGKSKKNTFKIQYR